MAEFSESMKKKWARFVRRMKEDRAQRTVVITAVTLLCVLSVLVAVTVAANRAKRQNAGGNETGGAESTSAVESTAGESESENEPVDAEIPVLKLPVSGSLGKKHDASTQVFSNTMQDYRIHLGVDLMTEEDAPVYAAAAGTVSKIWDDVRYGICVAISHGGDCVSIYKNLSVELADGIEEGAKVAAEQLIGAVGDTAMVEIAEEPHLHFEMTVNGLAVDPLDYFDEEVLAALDADVSYEEAPDGK